MKQFPIAIQVYSIRDAAEADFVGTMKALKDIDYQNDFSFELGSQRFPTAHRENWCSFIYRLGEDLLKMM